ncbi:MAG: CehA/McbA family metallohydrolase [Armatimonadota bacterium]|nr:CehA/McbA family metallohydrolase [Armatimonadota bacterium]
MHILDPYAVPGTDRRAQLHCHTTNSDGRYEPAEVVQKYRNAGYAFVAFTDHDRVTPAEGLSDRDFCTISGVERTIPKPVRPLGPHLSCLFVDVLPAGSGAQAVVEDVRRRGGVAGLNHPSWRGNLGSAGWSLRTMLQLRGYSFVEVWNVHSNSDEDTRRWAAAAAHHGPGHPIAPAAGDDLHVADQFDRAWVVVRVREVSAVALKEALIRGAVYASTGPTARFGVRDGRIVAQTDAATIRFLDHRGAIRREVAGPSAEYEPSPEDRFVRVECLGRSVGRAWSNIFWVLPAAGPR